MVASDGGVFDGYFDALERGDMAEAAEFFSVDARYSHPPYAEEPSGAGRHEVRGRAEIRKLFERRGYRTTRHEVQSTARDGQTVHLAGIVRDQEGTVVASFTSIASLDPRDGTISEYAAYSSRPPVWARLIG